MTAVVVGAVKHHKKHRKEKSPKLGLLKRYVSITIKKRDALLRLTATRP